LARVGHDLRAPLTAVVGYASRLEDRTHHDVGAIGRRIRQRAHELLALINGLIEYARVGAEPNRVRYQPVQFRAFLHDMRTDAQRMVQQCGHSFEWRVKGQLPDGVLLDSKRVHQVLSLLLQHTLTRLVCGKILCTVYALPEAAVGPDGVQRVMFMVHDNGPGFSAEDLVHIFQPLSSPGALPGQADWSVVIAQQWAERMGGYVKINSRIGQGTTLRFVLPVSRDMGSRDMLADRQAAAPHFSGG
jgi:two-component system, sensor histidine kinase LadS